MYAKVGSGIPASYQQIQGPCLGKVLVQTDLCDVMHLKDLGRPTYQQTTDRVQNAKSSPAPQVMFSCIVYMASTLAVDSIAALS